MKLRLVNNNIVNKTTYYPSNQCLLVSMSLITRKSNTSINIGSTYARLGPNLQPL